MKKTETKIDISLFPEEIRHVFDGARIYDSSCSADMRVLYCDTGYYVKIAERERLGKEAEMARLFAERKLGPKLVSYICRDKDYMVSESAAGEDALHYLDKPEALCEALCGAMKHLHEQPILGVPRSASMDAYDGNERCGILRCDSLIHGDFCLPNVIFDKGKFSTFIDLGGAGVGDRHIDIFWILWSLNYNLGTNKYADYVLDLYGMDKIDKNVLKFVAEVENAR